MPLTLPVILIFAAIALFSFSMMYILFPPKTIVRERLEGLAEEAIGARGGAFPGTPANPWQKFLEKLGGKISLRPKDYGKYRKLLVSAGIPPSMLAAFMGVKVLSAIAFPGIYILFYLGYGMRAGQKPAMAVIFLIILAAVGFIVPGFWLGRRARKRKLGIFYDLPDILDVMTVCVEAGLSVDASMIRISEDKQFKETSLAKEMKVAITETRAGKPRHEALRDMGERSGVEDLRALAAMLIQTERLGTSLADALRVHSDFLRTKRRQMAEEAAAKTAVKLIFPLAFFLLPSMFVVVLLPALIRLAHFFSEM